MPGTCVPRGSESTKTDGQLRATLLCRAMFSRRRPRWRMWRRRRMAARDPSARLSYD